MKNNAKMAASFLIISFLLTISACNPIPETLPPDDNINDPANPESIFNSSKLPAIAGVDFYDEDTAEDIITGTMIINKTNNETAIDGYRIYWGSDTITKLAGAPVLKEIEKTGSNISLTFPGSITSSVPVGATHLLVYTYYKEQEAENPYAYDIVDRVVEMVADVYENGDFSPSYLFVKNNLLYFTANSVDYGNELWIYDSTKDVDLDNSTALLRNPRIFEDINSGSASSSPMYFTAGEEKMYFIADNGGGKQIYSYTVGDSAYQATSTSGLINTMYSFWAAEVESHLYFIGYDATDWHELWYLQNMWPISFNPQQVADINSSSSSAPMFLCEFDNKLFFQANGGSAGTELWMYDPYSPTSLTDAENPSGGGYSTANPKMIADINPGSNGSDPTYMVEYDEKLFFQALDSSTYRDEIYSWDETNGLVQITTMEPNAGPADLTVYQDNLIFLVNDGTGLRMYSYDGDTYTRVSDVLNIAQSVYDDTFSICGDRIFFNASDSSGDTNYEPWYYDGSDVYMVADINPGSFNYSNPEGFTLYNNKVYFCADDGSYGEELYAYWVK